MVVVTGEDIGCNGPSHGFLCPGGDFPAVTESGQLRARTGFLTQIHGQVAVQEASGLLTGHEIIRVERGLTRTGGDPHPTPRPRP